MNGLMRARCWAVLWSISVGVGVPQGHTRWAPPQDAPLEIQQFNQTVTVHKDGTFDKTTQQHLKILNERGRANYGIQHLRYNSDIETLKVIEASTTTPDGTTHPVPSHQLEIKPLASSIQGFDQLSQVLIAYPNASVDAVLNLTFDTQRKQSLLKNYFAHAFFFGVQELWHHAHIRVQSELPLHVHTQDPQQALEVKQSRQGAKYILDIKLKKSVYHALAGENTQNSIDRQHLTYVHVSSAQKLEPLGTELAQDYAKVLEAPLPAPFQALKESAKNLTTPSEHINHITSTLSQTVQYMGDWRSIRGKMIPRPFAQSASTGLGDCKDFASITTALLRQLGYEAYVAIVNRGEDYRAPQTLWANLYEFNHAIVRAVSPQGQVFWIDPTNFVSMADGIFPDIADRPALVLNPQGAFLDQVPAMNPEHATILQKSSIQLDDQRTLKTQGTMTFAGEAALFFTGAELHHSRAEIEDNFFFKLCNDLDFKQKSLRTPPLTSRIVKDIQMDYAYTKDQVGVVTNAGLGLELPSDWMQPFLTIFADQAGVAYLGPLSTLSKTVLFQGMTALHIERLNYTFDTPWVRAQRVCRVVDQGIEVKDTMTRLKRFVTSEEAQSKAYRAFKEELQKYSASVLVLAPKSAS